MGPEDDSSKLPGPVLRPADHQVAGHRYDEGRLGSSIDESGRFYKPLQDGERGNREIDFYEKLQKDESIPSRIRSFFPNYFGSILIEVPNSSETKRHGILEDLAHEFHKPSIIDLKIGFRTWYPEASEQNIAKNKLKDTQTTTGALGFRVSGMQVYEESTDDTFRAGRDWARELSVDEVTVALKRFVSSNPQDETHPDAAFASFVYGGPHGVISELEVLKEWFTKQTTYHFTSSSVLVIYDANYITSAKNKTWTGQSDASKSVAVKLVDFAHTITGKSSVDENFLDGLEAVISLLSRIVESSPSS